MATSVLIDIKFDFKLWQWLVWQMTEQDSSIFSGFKKALCAKVNAAENWVEGATLDALKEGNHLLRLAGLNLAQPHPKALDRSPHAPTRNFGETSLPTISIVDKHHPVITDVHLAANKNATGAHQEHRALAGTAALKGETLHDLLKRLHPDLTSDQLNKEVKNVLAYNKGYGNDLHSGVHLSDGQTVYLTSIKIRDKDGHPTRIYRPTGEVEDIQYGEGGKLQGYTIKDTDGKVIESVTSTADGKYQLTRDGKTEILQCVFMDALDNISYIDEAGNKITHLTRGDDVSTVMSKEGKPDHSIAIRNGLTTASYRYQYDKTKVSVFARYTVNSGHASPEILLDSYNLANFVQDLSGVPQVDKALQQMQSRMEVSNSFRSQGKIEGSEDPDEYVKRQLPAALLKNISGNALKTTVIMVAEARRIGLSRAATVTMIASVLQESGGNARSKGDYRNGIPTSFGVLQFHDGGALNGLPGRTLEEKIAMAYKPAVEARYQGPEFEHALRSGKYADPGAAAAAVQRPADRTGYRRAVNHYLPAAEQLIAQAEKILDHTS